MKLEKKKLIVKREYKEVYKCEDGIVKIFEKDHPKADVFNEALNTARVEATGLDIPCVKEVSQVDGKWAILIEYKEGTTLEEMMEADPGNLRRGRHPQKDCLHLLPAGPGSHQEKIS